jgi:hypothetical protein
MLVSLFCYFVIKTKIIAAPPFLEMNMRYKSSIILKEAFLQRIKFLYETTENFVSLYSIGDGANIFEIAFQTTA